MKASADLKVGIFALIIILLLSYMTFKVGGLSWLRKKEGYIVYVYFKNISGLEKKSRIRVAGVDAGYIEDIELADGKAKLTLRVNPGIKLYSDACASIKTVGLLGENYLELDIGSKPPLLHDGDTLSCSVETADLGELIRSISKVSGSANQLIANLNKVLSDQQIRQLKETIASIRDTARNANTMVVENDKRARRVLDNANRLVTRLDTIVAQNQQSTNELIANLRDLSASLKTDVPGMIRDVKSTSGEIRSLVAQTKPQMEGIVNNVDKITSDLQQGKGTIGKLLKDETLYTNVNNAVSGLGETLGAITRFRTFLDFEAQYLTKVSDTRGKFTLTLQPSPDKYYIVGIVSDPIPRTVTQTNIVDHTVTTYTNEKKVIEFNAQYARRYKNTAGRLGITQNTFGLGVDQFFLNDRLKVSGDAWDFSAEEDGAKHPHVQIGASYYIFKHLYLEGGMDNLLNSNLRGVYFGGGLRFEDKDFKYLLGVAPSPRL